MFYENYFENIDTEEKAYWLGFISADGSIVKSSQYNSYRLQINLNTNDESHLEKFLQSVDAKTIKIYRTYNNKGFSKNGSNISRISLNSFKMCQDLNRYNVHQNKTYDIELPTNIDDKYMHHYLRGFFDGDGCYYYHFDNKNNRYRYCFELAGGSLIFMEQLKKYLLLKGIKLNIYVRKDNGVIRLMTGSKIQLIKLIDYIYKDSHVYLQRKYNKINEIKSIAA